MTKVLHCAGQGPDHMSVTTGTGVADTTGMGSTIAVRDMRGIGIERGRETGRETGRERTERAETTERAEKTERAR